ncbi:unnamed protein product [Durusdinium trenchii]|uniref:Uncharacterized protein n=1 Tax=Durusdinium trenchii TaxID=1381693 RepID=A0ABP0RG13_9DINO
MELEYLTSLGFSIIATEPILLHHPEDPPPEPAEASLAFAEAEDRGGRADTPPVPPKAGCIDAVQRTEAIFGNLEGTIWRPQSDFPHPIVGIWLVLDISFWLRIRHRQKKEAKTALKVAKSSTEAVDEMDSAGPLFGNNREEQLKRVGMTPRFH